VACGVNRVLEGVAGLRPVAPRKHLPAFDHHQAFVAHLDAAVKYQIVFGVGAEGRRARRGRRVERSAGLAGGLDVAPVEDKIFVYERDYPALAPDRADRVRFFFA
jgi:hypothetical protein